MRVHPELNGDHWCEPICSEGTNFFEGSESAVGLSEIESGVAVAELELAVGPPD